MYAAVLQKPGDAEGREGTLLPALPPFPPLTCTITKLIYQLRTAGFLSRALLLVCAGWERQTYLCCYSFSSHTASCINEQLGPNNRCEQKNVVMCVTCFLLFALFLYFKLEVAEAWQGWTYIQLVIFPPILCCLHTAVPTFKNSRKWRCGNWADIEDVVHKNGREWWQGLVVSIDETFSDEGAVRGGKQIFRDSWSLYPYLAAAFICLPPAVRRLFCARQKQSTQKKSMKAGI